MCYIDGGCVGGRDIGCEVGGEVDGDVLLRVRKAIPKSVLYSFSSSADLNRISGSSLVRFSAVFSGLGLFLGTGRFRIGLMN